MSPAGIGWPWVLERHLSGSRPISGTFRVRSLSRPFATGACMVIPRKLRQHWWVHSQVFGECGGLVTSITFDMFIRADPASLPIQNSSSTWLLSSFMVVAQRNSLPTGAVAPFVVCKDRVQSDHILTANARSTSSCSLPVPSPLCRDAPSSLLVTPFTSPLSTTPPPRVFRSFHSWEEPRSQARSRCASPVSPENVVWQPAVGL